MAELDAPVVPNIDQNSDPANPKPQPEDEMDLKVQASLKKIVTGQEFESDTTRRAFVRKWMEAEEFWKGNQHLFWNEKAFRWYAPFEYAVETNAQQEMPFYTYVTNVYQSYGLSVIAAMSQKLPKTQFLPVSAQSEIDLATAKAASDVCEYIEDRNELQMMAIREGYLLWTQGKVFSYIRYVVDEDYGVTQQPMIENSMVELFPDRYVCDQCGAETPSEPQDGSGLASGIAPQPTCQECGAPLNDSQFMPAENGEVPIVSGFQKVPNGMEKISLYGPLNVKVMPWANELRESGYLVLAEEVHKSAVMAAYESKADKIQSAGTFAGGGGGSSTEDSFERTQRLRLSEATSNIPITSAKPLSNVITYKRCWLRPWLFMSENDKEIRKELFRRFPDGVMVSFAGDVYLESRNEKLDEHWECADAMPGVGAYKEAIGGSTISLQKRINDVMNVEAEHVDFAAAPPVLTDSRFLNLNALRNKRMRPGSYHPVTTLSGAGQRNLQDMMWQPKISIDSNIYAHGKELIELVQLTSGAFPAIFGGAMQNVKTASGYAMARNQALGRLEMFWRSVKAFHARMMLKSVEIFRKNRTEDVERVIIGKSNDFSSKYIHMSNLQGHITARAQVDEDFPTSWQEVRQNITELMGIAPNWLGPLLAHPDNAPFVKRFLANSDLTIPVETQREKSYREIDWLLDGQPIQEIDPVTGMPKMMPSEMPEIDVDDHMVHIENIKQWAASDSGIQAKRENPMGYANVLAHLVAHKDMMKSLAAEQAEDSAHIQEAAITPGLVKSHMAMNPPKQPPEPPDGGNDGE
jgi:hypothetical protein